VTTDQPNSVGPLILSAGTNIGITTGGYSGNNSGSYTDEPSVVEDSSGNIYVAFVAQNCLYPAFGARWGVFFTVSTNGGSSFSTPKKLTCGGNTTYQWDEPDIIATPTASKLCVGANWEYLAGVDTYAVYYNATVTCSTNQGTTWSAPIDPHAAGGMMCYGHLNPISIAFDNSGKLLISAWDELASACTTVEPIVDVFTVSAASPPVLAYSTSYHVSPSDYYYSGVLAIACDPSSTYCSMAISISNTHYNVWQGEIYTSTNDFSSTNGPYVFHTSKWSTSIGIVNIVLDPQAVNYAPSGDDSAVSYLFNIGNSSTSDFGVKYNYTSNEWATVGKGCLPPSGLSGYMNASSNIDMFTPTGASMLTWVYANGTEAVSSSPSIGTCFSPNRWWLTTKSVGGVLGIYSPASQVGHWRADVLWTANTTPTKTYYANFTGPEPTPSIVYNPVDSGVSDTFSVSSTIDGMGALTYLWHFDDGTTSTSASQAHTYTVGSTTTYTVWLWVNDSWGFSGTAAVVVTVHTDTVIADSIVPSPVDVGVLAHLLGSVSSGGTSPFVYTWCWGGGGGGAVYSHSPSPWHAYNSSNTFTVTIYINDSGGYSATTTASLTVNAVTTPSASIVPTSPDATVVAHMLGSRTGGTTPFSYSWCWGLGTCATPSHSISPWHAYNSSGTWIARFFVNDSGWYNASTTLSVTVNPANTVPSALIVPASPDVNIIAHLLGGRTGGTAGFTYSWCWGLGGCATPSSSISPWHAYNSTGTFTARFFVNDSG
jgi:hypothetical protein